MNAIPRPFPVLSFAFRLSSSPLTRPHIKSIFLSDYVKLSGKIFDYPQSVHQVKGYFKKFRRVVVTGGRRRCQSSLQRNGSYAKRADLAG